MHLYTPPAPRSVLQINGPDATDFLQGMITNDMKLLHTQPAIYAGLLTPQGKVISTFFVVRADDGYWLDCPAGAFAILQKRFLMFRLRADVQFADVSDQMQIALGAEEHTNAAASFADPRCAKLGFRHLIAPADFAAGKDVRFAQIVPEQDIDYQSGEVFPSDINMDLQNGIAWKKGCYVGQEVVSRMKRRGNIRKRTALAVFEHSAPATGTPITAGKSTIGHICSVHGQKALATVRTDRVAKAREKDIEFCANEQSLCLTLPSEE